MRFKWSLLVANASKSIIEVNTVSGKYIVLTIKPVPLLLQNALEKVSGCIGLYWPVPISIGISTNTIKIEKNY